MSIFRTCDGVTRRDFIKVGAIGATGLTLENYLRLANADESTSVKGGKAKAAIFINLRGGPSHLDTFDMKPDAPTEYRGEFNPISTKVSGIEISEHLPKLAENINKFTILRGVSHFLGAHNLGQEYVNTGNVPLASLEYPSTGAVISKELGGQGNLPPTVAIPNANHKAGFLGVRYNPLETGSVPRAGASFSVRGIQMQNGLTISQVEKRANLLGDLDKTFQGFEKENQLLEGLDEFAQQAHSMITSKEARLAFDVNKEEESIKKLYGSTPSGNELPVSDSSGGIRRSICNCFFRRLGYPP